MPTHATLTALFNDIADAIRAKTGETSQIVADDFPTAIANIPMKDPVLQEKTATPTESSQDITPSSGYDGLSKVTVNAISSTYVGSGVTRQASKTVTPTKSSQTAVASGVYTTGAITVGAIPAQYIVTTDATASAGDIVQSKTAYVNGSKVTGSLVIQKYYTGSSTPASSLGNNGDLYLKV